MIARTQTRRITAPTTVARSGLMPTPRRIHRYDDDATIRRIIPSAVHVHRPKSRDDIDLLQQQSEQRASSAMRSLAEAEGCARCAIKTCSHGSLGNCASHDHEGVMTDSGLRAIGMQEV